MQNATPRISQVTYNGQSQAFEALVTVHDDQGDRRYACALSGPITMPFQAAAAGLVHQAQQNHAKRRGLRSVRRAIAAPQRQNRPPFDAAHWLESLRAEQEWPAT